MCRAYIRRDIQMIEYASITDNGGRAVNEDSLIILQKGEEYLFVLCDGLGGHGAGEVASSMTTEAAREIFLSSELESEKLLEACALKAQQNLHARRLVEKRSDDCKTTLTLLHIKNNVANIAHIGDSRVYTFHKASLKGRTQDHSVPQMLVLQGEIKEQDIRFHEDRNRLVRVLGDDSEVPRLAVSPPVELKSMHKFLLCSDGYWELITEKDMCSLLKSNKTASDWLNAMNEVVKKNGVGKNMDNYSAIAVFIS